ncbi:MULTISPECIES: hypothetical protein [unclassified Ruegeria]|uniref:hypothetical protein n=1 Tax=unclassified Ruegeria TaxID=2625375 RepID=UPI001490A55A|nr:MULTISPECIES: hypothetical protein [unclassified Ruegeria]NOD76857.1 hypothetical protein [Ruegeria sp. HKCCD4332]NOD88380.1 hypothetical protein [Ruegeria sp. HKCCD4318]NOE13289.1 hypothetical protein [Ruegeria sp. HKCCD4318-2]NOG11169.1 hypothetical protein [Ruegeria sp. HKCCD4315]
MDSYRNRSLCQVFGVRTKIGFAVLFSFIFLAACKPKEISLRHIGSVKSSSSLFGMSLENCAVRFELENGNSEIIHHLGFEVTVMDPLAAQEPKYDIFRDKWTGGPRNAYSRSDHVRYVDLPSGKSTLFVEFPKQACEASFEVHLTDISCRIGEEDCAEAVVYEN